MNLLKARIFSGGLFKQAKFLASSPQRAECPVYISETGTISKETMPMSTGCLSSEKEHMTWAVVHSLKLKLKKYGAPVQDAGVLLISERSYVPLDPFGKIKPKDKEKVASLDAIAKNRHSVERAQVGTENASSNTPLTEAVTYGSLVIIAMCVLLKLVGCGGGG